MSVWQRRDVKPGDLFKDNRGGLWRVIGIADEPTVELQAIVTDFGTDEGRNPYRTFVISSPLFAENFPEKLEPRRPS